MDLQWISKVVLMVILTLNFKANYKYEFIYISMPNFYMNIYILYFLLLIITIIIIIYHRQNYNYYDGNHKLF